MSVRLKTEKDIEMIRESGRILSDILTRLVNASRPGTKLKFLDKLAYDLASNEGAKPSFLNYRPEGAQDAFPASICASLGSTVVHGIPDDYALQEGDILKIDFGIDYKGFFSDAARTVVVGGNMSPEIERLVSGTKRALDFGISAVQVGKKLGDVGAAIESVAKKNRLGIILELTGHGVGFGVHEDPMVFNYGNPGTGMTIKEGMVLALEPMFSLGRPELIELPDGSFKTRDGSPTAHFEDTIAITSNGVEILTRWE